MRPNSSIALVAFSVILNAQSPASRHPLKLDDLARIHEVRDPQCSPDGHDVAYVVATVDQKEDKTNTHIWEVGIDGKDERQLTYSQDSESAPRWSPDGKYLSFTSSRPGKAKGNQVWLMERSGGEAFQLTDVKGRLQSYEWSPDSKRLSLVIGDPDPDSDSGSDNNAANSGKPKTPKPIVIDRYHSSRTFKATFYRVAIRTSTSSMSRPKSWTA